jgi:hypothetical protein
MAKRGWTLFLKNQTKLKQHADCGTFDVDALDIEKLNTETDTWSWLIAR